MIISREVFVTLMEQNEKWKMFKLMRLSIPYLNVTDDSHNVVLKASTVQPFPFLRNHTAFINMSPLCKETTSFQTKFIVNIHNRFTLDSLSKH